MRQNQNFEKLYNCLQLFMNRQFRNKVKNKIVLKFNFTLHKINSIEIKPYMNVSSKSTPDFLKKNNCYA